MSALKSPAVEFPALERMAADAGRDRAYVKAFADAARAVLNTPMGDPGYRDAVLKLRITLMTWDDEPQAPEVRPS